MRPNALVAGMLLRRGLLLWLGARCVASAVLRLAGADVLHLAPQAVVAMIVIATAAALAQTMRLRERLFLGNLGVGLPAVAALFAAAAVAGELAVAALGLLRA